MANSNHSLEKFQGELDEIISKYRHPEERRIGYGNLRHEYSEWEKDDAKSVNIAVIYETPGGSTTQINVTYDKEKGTFTYLDRDLENQVTTGDYEEVLGAIKEEVQKIPGKRADQLINQINSWIEMGKGRHEIFSELNKLLQTEFLGGRITTTELKEGIQHVVEMHSNSNARA
ncbi:MAG: hypothetical protein ACLFWB_06130 [Armatimonadota bacterium]